MLKRRWDPCSYPGTWEERTETHISRGPHSLNVAFLSISELDPLHRQTLLYKPLVSSQLLLEKRALTHWWSPDSDSPPLHKSSSGFPADKTNPERLGEAQQLLEVLAPAPCLALFLSDRARYISASSGPAYCHDMLTVDDFPQEKSHLPQGNSRGLYSDCFKFTDSYKILHPLNGQCFSICYSQNLGR